MKDSKQYDYVMTRGTKEFSISVDPSDVHSLQKSLR
jgi:hypothetical protein